MSEQVLVNPDDPTQTYTLGKRGRRPPWVAPLLESMGSDGSKEPAKMVKKDVDGNTLMAWSMSGKCIIVAENMLSAMRMFNRTTVNPITMNELNTLWKRDDSYSGDFGSGVWVMKDAEWIHRPILAVHA